MRMKGCNNILKSKEVSKGARKETGGQRERGRIKAVKKEIRWINRYTTSDVGRGTTGWIVDGLIAFC